MEMSNDKTITETPFVIPEKDWNAEKGKMESTSLPEWQEYYNRLKDFTERMNARKPVEPQAPPLYFAYYTVNGRTAQTGYEAARIYTLAMQEYKKELSEWNMAMSCDAPNKPGYVRANND